MIFKDKLYKPNIPGGITVFSPVGIFDLGDRVVFEVIKKKYVDDNPREKVYFFDKVIMPDQIIKEYQPDKFFWADVSKYCNPPDGVICYDLYREAEALRELGFYPKVWLEEQELTFPLTPFQKGESYVVLHLRNVDKRPEKNVDPKIVLAVLNYLLGLGKTVILVGNDEPIIRIEKIRGFSLGDSVIDLRFKLSLLEIIYILKRAKLFIGLDSGIAHLAGACSDCPMAVWGFWDEIYVPKVMPGRIRYLMREESTVENIISIIDSMLLS